MPTTAPPRDGRAVVPAGGKRTGHWRRRLLALLAVLAVLFTALGVGAAMVYVKLDGNILSEDVGNRLGVRPKAPPSAANGRDPLNILVMGSDTRGGANAEYAGGQVEGERSDTTILLHLSADRQRAVAVSIPRDTQVTIPACTKPDGTRIAEHQAMFNSAYQLAGSACTIQTVEALTGIYINHHVVVDFSGFKRMVDALGGVDVCLPKPVRDVKSGLDLPAGRQEVDGEQALAYVRTRYALSNGSDLSRIERQQLFLAAMIQKAKSSEVLTRPDRLISFLDAATQSVTTDPELASLNDLSGLARQVQGIGLDRVRFLTTPNEPWPVNPNRVQLTPAADDLWRLLREDSPLPGEKAAAKPAVGATTEATAGAASASSPTPTVQTRPQQVRVRVLNGSGQP
ncbi:MAG: LCP family protein, partial [Actinomycetota bacterium]|nr:LCP family protein [Actinomycetota bacterium]